MSKTNISLRIDVSKIDKERLYKGKKGTYLDAVLFLNDEPDQYDQNGMIVESITKEEREAGDQGTILGNAKILGQQNKPSPEPEKDAADMDDDLPF